MRPIQLTMQAFGSYGGETSVDFEAFTGGLYLIVGKTGAGKTTIFDAISFALFGKPSGSERTVDMLHSDFAEKSVDTRVRLRFAHQGREYTVERCIHFRKKRGTEDEYGEGKVEATLWEPERDPMEGATRVTDRIETLLGMNAEQFRRIVMLAQGEFRKFLAADSDEKNKILGRLFDNAAYLSYQNLLGAARDALKQQRDRRTAALATLMEVVFRPPTPTEDGTPERWLPGNPQLLTNLDELINREAEEAAALAQSQQTSSDEANVLTRQEGAAEADNALLEELDRTRARLTELENRQTEMEALQERYAAAERALHRVKPKQDALERAEFTLDGAKGAVQRLTAELSAQQTALKLAEAAVAADGPARAELETLNGEIRKWHDALPLCRELAEKERDLVERSGDLRRSEELLRDAEALRDHLQERADALRKETAELEGADAETVQAESERSSTRERRDAVTAPKTGLADRAAALDREAGALDGDAAALCGLAQEALRAEEDYHRLYQAFLSGQAGVMAAEMERELAETGQATCPVCRTTFCADLPHHFALPEAETPDEGRVKRAEKRFRDAEENRRRREAALKQGRALLEQKRESLLEEAGRLDPGLTRWEHLRAPTGLAALAARLERELLARERALSEAQSRQQRRRTLLQEAEQNRRETETVAASITKENAARERLAREVDALTAAAAELKKQLPLSDEREIHAEIAALERKRDEISSTLQLHETERQRAQGHCDRTAGGLKIQKESLPTLEAALALARGERTAALDAAGFADPEAYRAALPPEDGMAGERTLREWKETLDCFEHERRSTGERLAELSERTKGKRRTDLTLLRERLSEKRAEAEATALALAAQNSLLENHRSVREQAGALRAELAGTDRAWMRIERLAALALGSNADGGKLSFDRYVMGTIFREVLEMANRRLDVMTGGRFELVHSLDAGRKNAVTGLEIEVLDVAVGKRRPSGSISGGESFMVSLALALGLSDVVQNHAGGQKLDTLFIDEGFGSLDDGKLDNVITVLRQLTEGRRLVGIISHVDKLEESIPQKLRVRSTDRGSVLEPELS